MIGPIIDLNKGTANTSESSAVALLVFFACSAPSGGERKRKQMPGRQRFWVLFAWKLCEKSTLPEGFFVDNLIKRYFR